MIEPLFRPFTILWAPMKNKTEKWYCAQRMRNRPLDAHKNPSSSKQEIQKPWAGGRIHKDNYRHLPRFPDFFVTSSWFSLHWLDRESSERCHGRFYQREFSGHFFFFIFIMPLTRWWKWSEAAWHGFYVAPPCFPSLFNGGATPLRFSLRFPVFELREMSFGTGKRLMAAHRFPKSLSRAAHVGSFSTAATKRRKEPRRMQPWKWAVMAHQMLAEFISLWHFLVPPAFLWAPFRLFFLDSSFFSSIFIGIQEE